MKKITVVFFALLLSISCGEEQTSTNDPDLFIPVNPDYIIKTSNLQELLKVTDSVSFIRNNNILGGENIRNQLKALSAKLKSGVVLISFSREEVLTKYLLLAKSDLALTAPDSLKNEKDEISVDPEGFFTKIHNGVFIAGNSQPLLKNSLDNAGIFLDQNPNFTVARAATGNDKSSLFLNASNQTWLNSFMKYIPVTANAIGDWLVIELDFEDINVAFHGIATLGSSPNKVLKLFQNTGNKINQAASITPTSAKGFYSFTFSDFQQLQENLSVFDRDSLNISEDHYLNFTEEAGSIVLNSGSVNFIRTNDPDITAASFKFPIEMVKEFRGTTIYEDRGQSEALKLFSPLLSEDNSKFFAFLESFLLFSDTSESLEKVISEYYNKATLENNPAYQKSIINLAEASTLLVVNNNFERRSSTSSEDTMIFSTDDYDFTALQFVMEDKFAHLHGILSNSEVEASTGIQQISSTNLISGLGIPPHLIKNQNTNNPNIVVQDETNMLYQITEKGDLISKTQLEGRILGEIKQVDIYSNGNLQIAFVTQNALHIIDRNGNNVAPFPILFKEPVTQPLSIFDYDSNNDYRFVITQEDNLLMYNSKGKLVEGFNFDETKSIITTAPVHIRTQNKDYILVQEESGKLNVVSRQGKSRISVEEPVTISDNNWYLNKGEFTSISSNGELITINDQGKVIKTDLSAEGQPKIKANNDLLVVLDENVLKINSKEVLLDFGLYTIPKIFDIGNKSYINITDLQSKRVLIFDQEGNLLPGLPVYGNSAADILVLGKEMFFAVQGEANSVLLYKIPL